MQCWSSANASGSQWSTAGTIEVVVVVGVGTLDPLAPGELRYRIAAGDGSTRTRWHRTPVAEWIPVLFVDHSQTLPPDRVVGLASSQSGWLWPFDRHLHGVAVLGP